MLNIISGIPEEEFNDIDMETTYKWDNFQINAFNNIKKNKDTLVVAPTSSGKTAVAKYGIIYTTKTHNKKVIYTSPIKSLSNEKYNEFKILFPDLKIGLLTGDHKINIDADVLIVTTEIIRNYLISKENRIKQNEDGLNNNIMDHIGCIIIDEIHFINDPNRGKVWEDTLILLDRQIQLIMLSATVDKPEDFANWLISLRNKDITIIKETKRIIPLTYNYFYDNELFEIVDVNGNFNRKIFMNLKKEFKSKEDKCLNKLLLYMQKNDLYNALFFVFSKKKCEQYAKSVQTRLVDKSFEIENENIFDSHIRNYKHLYEKNPRYIDLKDMIIKGIAYHHAGLPIILKEIIEILFKLKRIKVLFATETFAVGINSPTRSVVFIDIEKYTDGNKRTLTPAEFKQMSGRAGRRGMDTKGNVIILLSDKFYDNIPSLIDHPPDKLFSEIDINYQNYINLYSSIDNYFDKTMVCVSYQNNINKLITENDTIDMELSKIDKEILKSFEELYQNDSLSLTSVKIKQTKSQIQKQKTLNKIKENYGSEYNNFIRRKKITRDIDFYSQYKNNLLYKLNTFLNIHGYINNNEITIKGKLLMCINECNPFIIVEIFVAGWFDNLSSIEIIQVLSIFCDKVNNEYYNPTIPCKIQHLLLKIYNLTEKFINTEDELQNCNYDYWTTNTSYIELAGIWASGKPVECILNILYDNNEYEGNFIKNMIKIINIAKSIKLLCELTNKLELIENLDKIEQLLLRDIVNNASLYLT